MTDGIQIELGTSGPGVSVPFLVVAIDTLKEAYGDRETDAIQLQKFAAHLGEAERIFKAMKPIKEGNQ